jgi:hypothetical protein
VSVVNCAIVAGVSSTITGARSVIGAGNTNQVATSDAGIVTGIEGSIEADCSASVICGGGAAANGNEIQQYQERGIIGAGYANVLQAAEGTASNIENGILAGRTNIIGDTAETNTAAISRNIIGAGISNIIGDNSTASIVGNGILAGNQNAITHATAAVNYSGIGAGQTNTVGGSYCFIAGGLGNAITSGSRSFMGAGSGNTIAGDSARCVILGGQNHVIGNDTGPITSDQNVVCTGTTQTVGVTIASTNCVALTGVNCVFDDAVRSVLLNGDTFTFSGDGSVGWAGTAGLTVDQDNAYVLVGGQTYIGETGAAANATTLHLNVQNVLEDGGAAQALAGRPTGGTGAETHTHWIGPIDFWDANGAAAITAWVPVFS